MREYLITPLSAGIFSTSNSPIGADKERIKFFSNEELSSGSLISEFYQPSHI